MGTGAQAFISPRAIGNDAQARFHATKILKQIVRADGAPVIHARYRAREALQYLAFHLNLLWQKGSHPANRSHLRYLLEITHQLCRGSFPLNSELQSPCRAGGFNG